MVKIMKAMIERAAESLNTQFAPVNTVSPDVVLTVGDDYENKAVVVRLDGDDDMRVKIYAKWWGYPVYEYFVRRDDLAHEVVEEINRRLGFLREILSRKDALVDAQNFGFEVEVIWDAMQSMVEGVDADTAVRNACNEWDV